MARWLRRTAAADRRAGRDATESGQWDGIVNIETTIPPEFRANAKMIGDDEIAWRGTDIVAVLKEIVRSGAIILGIDIVYFREASSGPVVDAVSDSSAHLPREPNEPWDRYAERSLAKSIFDIERNVRNPYGDDVWYIVVSRRN